MRMKKDIPAEIEQVDVWREGKEAFEQGEAAGAQAGRLRKEGNVDDRVAPRSSQSSSS